MELGTVLLSKDDVRRCLDMADCIDICDDVFQAYGRGQVIMPAKLSLNLGEGQAWPHYGASVNAMPAYVGPIDKAGLKWAGGWSQNRDKNLPYIMGAILLIEPDTGLLLAVMDGGYITDLRTGAQTGVAARYLASPRASRAAVIGAGAQGRMNLRAAALTNVLEEVRVTDVSFYHAEKFAETMSRELGVNVIPTKEAEEAVDGAHIIITATPADDILVKKEWVGPGALISSIGSFPELDPELVLAADKVVVDSWIQNSQRGELSRLVRQHKFSEADLYAELGQIAAEEKPGRQHDDEIIVCCLIGMGMLDTACADHVYQKALRMNVGRRFDFGQHQTVV